MVPVSLLNLRLWMPSFCKSWNPLYCGDEKPAASVDAFLDANWRPLQEPFPELPLSDGRMPRDAEGGGGRGEGRGVYGWAWS